MLMKSKVTDFQVDNAASPSDSTKERKQGDWLAYKVWMPHGKTNSHCAELGNL